MELNLQAERCRVASKDLLIELSRSLRSPLARCANLLSNTPLRLFNAEVAYEMNRCIAMIIRNAFQEGLTLRHTQLLRADDKSEGLQKMIRRVHTMP